MSRDRVLLLTNRRDFYVPDLVAAALSARGMRPLRVDTDQYPTAVDLEIHHSGGQGRVRAAGLPCHEIRGVWIRRLAPPALPAAVPEDACAAIRREARSHWRGALDVLAATGAVLVNDIHAVARVEGHKPWQLLMATAAGLRTPETLVTNDPDAARAFHARCGADVVVKMLTPLGQGMGSVRRVPTRRLSAEDLAALDELRLGPMCFQERIVARRELRVAYVGGRCFVGAQACAPGTVDWREQSTPWQEGDLDDDTAHAIDRMMRRMGLSYGAIDLMLPEDGGPAVFLEVNPGGEWGMLQRDLGLPIAEAIADTLAEPA